ncbi:MAG: SOS response-associated peptidase [Bacteroidota bacterium]
MCGRYSYTTSLEAGEVILPAGDAAINLSPRYNVAPSQYCPIIPQRDPRQTYMYRWGLIPFWAKDISIGYKMINARSETVTEKSTYARPFQKSRCLVLADGFYEWKGKGKNKQPYRIVLRSGKPFYFAGLYSEWKSPEGNGIPSFTILTTEPNELVAPIHNRMPVILNKEAALNWLTPSAEAFDLLNLLRPYPMEEMEAYPVSKAVGNVRNDSEELIAPVDSPS